MGIFDSHKLDTISSQRFRASDFNPGSGFVASGWVGSTVLSANIDFVSRSIARVVLQDSDFGDPVCVVERNLPVFSNTFLGECFVTASSATLMARAVSWIKSTNGVILATYR